MQIAYSNQKMKLYVKSGSFMHVSITLSSNFSICDGSEDQNVPLMRLSIIGSAAALNRRRWSGWDRCSIVTQRDIWTSGMASNLKSCQFAPR